MMKRSTTNWIRNAGPAHKETGMMVRTSTVPAGTCSIKRGLAAVLLAAGAAVVAPAGPVMAQVVTHLGILPGGYDSQAFGISADGSVVVGAGDSGYRAFRWTSAGGMQELFSGIYYSAAYGISSNGSVIVGEYDPTGSSGTRAFRWTQAGGLVELPMPASWQAGAHSASADGSVISGWASDPDSGLPA